MSDIVNVVLIPALMFLGIALRQAKVGLRARHLELLIIYLTAPILLFTEGLKIKPDTFFLGGVVGVSLLYMALCFSVSYGSSRWLTSREKGTVIFNSTFFNSMFLPFPLIYAFYGDLSVAVLFSVPIAIVHNTVGVFLASYWGHGKVRREVLIRAATYPPLIGFFIGFLGAPMSTGFVSSSAFGVLSSLGLSSLYLSLVFVGLAIPLSKDSLFVFRNRLTSLITLNRLLVSPVIALILISLLSPAGIAKNTILIMSFMPPAFTNIVITSRFGLDVKATSQGIFLPTLVSMGIIFALRFFTFI